MPYTCVIDLWLWMTLRDTSKLIKRYYSPKILRYVVACSLNSVQFRGNDTVQSAHCALHWQIRPIFPEKVLMFPQKCVFSLASLHTSYPSANTDFLPQIWCSPFNKDQTPFSFKENTQSVSFQRLQYLKIARGTTDPGVTPLLGATFWKLFCFLP